MFKKKVKYELIPSEGFSQVKLLSGKFKGIIYKYGVVRPRVIDDHLSLCFSFQVIKNPNNIDIENNGELMNVTGDILVDIIENDGN